MKKNCQKILFFAIEISIMIRIGNRTQLSAQQLRLAEIFSVARVLASRGCHVSSEGNGDDTILKKSCWSIEEANLIFDVFHDPSRRFEFLEFIDRGRQPNSSATKTLVEFTRPGNVRQSFSSTFEWYIGELLVRKFQAFSSSYSVKIDGLRRPSNGGNCGDFDVLSVLGDMSLLYIECKTGGFSRDAILRMLDRGRALHCSAAVMLIGNKFEPSSIKSKLEMNHPYLGKDQDIARISVAADPASGVYKWGDSFFVEADEARGNIEVKLRTILRLIAASRVEVNRAIALNTELCSALVDRI